jgi:hypothetical protein
VRAEFHVHDSKKALASVRWDRRGLDISADREIEAKIRRIFRPTPVVVDDPAYRSSGTSGPVVLHPGSLLWFRSAAQVRSGPEGLNVRFVPEGQDVMGWDPAGAYRTFGETVERKELSGVAARPEEAEAGETRPEGARGPSEPGTEAAIPATPPSSAGPAEAQE